MVSPMRHMVGTWRNSLPKPFTSFLWIRFERLCAPWHAAAGNDGSGGPLQRDTHQSWQPSPLIGGQPNSRGGIFKVWQKPPIVRDPRTLELSVRFKSRTCNHLKLLFEAAA
jgi:hypothetical protein